ncbi:MAG: class I SAM-dependent methyltransferase [Bdellovibrionaceae bacterium]|nr:class I SAM-dependent methyltransferase [Pseudobdellovibrionaceae bacterium]
MKNVGDVGSARENYLRKPLPNLRFLLSRRFSWMNEYCQQKDVVIELGSGAGFSKFFIENPKLRLTDVSGKDWIDEHVDALNIPYKSDSVDVFILSHMIHHVAKPSLLLESLARALRPGGVILIHDVNASLAMRAVLFIMRHEGWSFDVSPFDKGQLCNDPSDPWSANCAISNLLFDDHDLFHKNFPSLRIVEDRHEEFFTFLLSGGVIAKTFTIPLPEKALAVFGSIDNFLTKWFPNIFALSRRIVLQKRLV